MLELAAIGAVVCLGIGYLVIMLLIARALIDMLRGRR